MVNLVITGKAVSNTFDNTMEIDTGGAKKVILVITLFFFVAVLNDKFQRNQSSQSQRA